MKSQWEWRELRRPMQMVMRHGWRYGMDLRRKGGCTLISPRNTVYEFRAQPRPMARRFADYSGN